MLIYSDITERKRAEADIRAARDTAEKALGDLQRSAGQPDPGREDGLTRPAYRRDRARDQEPAQFRQQLCWAVGRTPGGVEGDRRAGSCPSDPDIRAEIDETIDMLTGNLDKIAEHGKRADNIVKSMLEHSRGVSGERREVDLNALIDEALNLAYHGARAQDQSFNITLERDFHPASRRSNWHHRR